MNVKLTFKAPKGTRRKDVVITAALAQTPSSLLDTNSTQDAFEAMRNLLNAESIINKLLPTAQLTITLEGSVENG